MSEQFAEKVREIISNNVYLSLASSLDDRPWISTLYYSFDEHYNFYFRSAINSIHAQQLLANSRTAIAIYDSTIPPGVGEGVQIEGIASVVEGDELPYVINNYYKRRFPDEVERQQHDMSPDRFLGESILRFFKVTPEHIYTRDTRITSIDQRIEVFLT